MKAKGGTWDFDALNKFIANPKAAVPGKEQEALQGC